MTGPFKLFFTNEADRQLNDIKNSPSLKKQYCVFWRNPASHSDLIRPPVLVENGHLF